MCIRDSRDSDHAGLSDYAGGGHYLSRLFARYDEAGTGKGLAMGNLDPVSLFKAATPEVMKKATLDLLEATKFYPNFVREILLFPVLPPCAWGTLPGLRKTMPPQAPFTVNWRRNFRPVHVPCRDVYKRQALGYWA